MPDSTETPFFMLIENVNDIFFTDLVIDTKCVHSYTHPRIVKTLKKIGKKFFEGDRHSKTNSKQGVCPLHKYALFMYICTFYAHFMHFFADSITYTISVKMAHFRPKNCHFVAPSRARWPLKCSTKKDRETIAH